MHCGMAAGRPTRTATKKWRVVLFPNDDFARADPSGGRRLVIAHLRMTFQAKVVVSLDEHLGID